MKRLPALIVATAAALSVVLLGAGCGAVAPYAAVVNGERITRDDLDSQLKALRSNRDFFEKYENQWNQQGVIVRGRGNGTFDAAFVAQLLTDQIVYRLVHQQVQERKLRVDPEAIKDARDQFTANIGDEDMAKGFPKDLVDQYARTSAEVDALEEDLARELVGDDDVEKHYRDNPTQFVETCMSHLGVATKAAADAARARIAGGADFEQVANEVSPGQGEATRCYTSTEATSFFAPLRQAMDSLPPGEVSAPIQTEGGFFVIRVNERRPQPFDEVRDQIREQLSGGRSQGALNEFLLKAVADSDIKVNPRYGRWVAGDQDEGVLPHVEPPRKPSTSTTAAGPAETPFGSLENP